MMQDSVSLINLFGTSLSGIVFFYFIKKCLCLSFDKKCSKNGVVWKYINYVKLSSLNEILNNCCINCCKLQHNKSGLYQQQSARVSMKFLFYFQVHLILFLYVECQNQHKYRQWLLYWRAPLMLELFSYQHLAHKGVFQMYVLIRAY